jgi:pepF/M3 family oligoendopeptidase
MAAPESLPRWDMTVVFPSLQSPAYEAAVTKLITSVEALEQLFDEQKIENGEISTSPAATLDAVLPKFNQLLDDARTIRSYVSAFVTTDTRNPVAQARSSELDPISARMRNLNTRLVGWTGSQDRDLLLTSDLGKAHRYAIEKASVSAQRMLSPIEEALATDLSTTGQNAWAKLHGNVSSQVTVPIDLHNHADNLPMSAVRALAYDEDRATRQHAYEAELSAWTTVEVPIAAALNSIKGEVSTLAKKRGWESSLEEALFNANIDRPTLDAMMTAARESFPDFRRYLGAKARVLGLPKLAWFDIFAPIEGGDGNWEYTRATEFVKEQFGSYSTKLADYADRAFRENWIDVPPAPGKVDGAYCMGLRNDESRILMNYKPAFGSVSTLALELGHGYHNLCLADRTAVQSTTPMTLAETASIFCETIIRQAVLTGNASQGEKLSVLEASLQGSCQVVVDITSRFLFESSVFEQRAKRELSPAEFCETMLDSQRQTYGDGLDGDLLHPYMWAAKPHYYSGRSFYNFPYMFGLLFGLGLFNIYKNEPNGFHARYDELLSSTGLADAATLGQRFGIDIRDVAFWRGSLDQIRTDIDQFVRLTA